MLIKFSKYRPYYAGIMLDAFGHLLCFKLCWHNRPVPSYSVCWNNAGIGNNINFSALWLKIDTQQAVRNSNKIITHTLIDLINHVLSFIMACISG